MSTGDLAVVLIAWRRPYYLQPVLESWAKVRGVEDLALFRVSLDASDRTEAMRQAIQAAPFPADVRVNFPSFGVQENPRQAIAAVFRECPDVRFVVLAEEDLVVADDVLEYFAWAAEEFRGRPEVLMVCAQSMVGCGFGVEARQGDDQAAVGVYSRFTSCWVWGTWRDRWSGVLDPRWDYATPGPAGEPPDWAWYINWYVMPSGFVSVAPDVPRSQNIGQYEGVHASPAEFAGTQFAAFAEHRDPVAYKEVPCS